MSTELITMTDDPYKNATDNHIDRQEISLLRFAGPGTMKDRRCLSILIRREGSMDGEAIFLTRSQAHVLRDVLTDHILG